MNNPYYKVTCFDESYPYSGTEIEISNRVLDLNEFFKNADFENRTFTVEKLSDEEFEETEDYQ